MGLIRKTLSISTLGLVDFRSKKELLRRAEASLDEAVAELEKEQTARSLAEGRISTAEKRTRQAELEALAAAKKAAKLRGKKGKHAQSLADRLSEALEAAEPKMKASAEGAKVRGRRARRKAAKAAKDAREFAEPYIDKASDAAIDLRDEVVDRGRKAKKAAAKATEKATAGRH
jgi:hypothetical protein